MPFMFAPGVQSGELSGGARGGPKRVQARYTAAAAAARIRSCFVEYLGTAVADERGQPATVHARLLVFGVQIYSLPTMLLAASRTHCQVIADRLGALTEVVLAAQSMVPRRTASAASGAGS